MSGHVCSAQIENAEKINGMVIWHAKSKKDLHGTLSSRLKDLIYIYIYMVFVFLFPIIPTIQIFSAFEKVGQTRHDSRQGCCLWLWRAQVQMFHLHGGTWEAESSPTLLESFGMILVFPAWPKRKM